jgi:hypothetical protein
MLKSKILLLVILIIIGVHLAFTWTNIIFTEYVATWQHYLALIFFFPLIFFFRYEFKKAVLFTGIYLILGTCNLLALTPFITTNSFGIRIGSLELEMPTFQLYSFLLLLLFFILNFNTLVEYYLEYQDAKKKK